MKNVSIGIVLLAAGISVLPAQDLTSGGANSWIFHTPDDGRTSLYLAPGTNGANWDWTKQWMFGGNGVLTGNSIQLLQGLSVVRDLGTNDYTYIGQHQMHVRIKRASDQKAVELGVLDNGTAVLQANEAGVGYNSLALNPVTGNVGIGTISPSTKLDVAGNAAIANATSINPDLFHGRIVAGGISDGSGWGLTTSIGGNSGVGRSWAIGSNGGDLYMGYQNSVSGASMQTFLQVSPNRNVYLVPVSGDVGIGTITPSNRLHVAGGRLQVNTGAAWDNFQIHTDGTHSYLESNGDEDGLIIRSNGGGKVIFPVGNVGIGTTSLSHKLTVNGTIRAKEVIVDTGWADYVFAEDYRLAPLSEIEAHIKAHKHLPDMPSAAEVAENGVSMGEMQARLLAKFEEMTLHMIEQEKMLKAQQQEITALRAEVARLSQ